MGEPHRQRRGETGYRKPVGISGTASGRAGRSRTRREQLPGGGRRPVLGVLVTVAAAAVGCYPSYAPPIRWGVGIMPEPHGRGGGSAQIGYGYPMTSHIIEPRAAFGVSPWLDLDAGGGVAVAGKNELPMFMGSLGIRYYPVQHRIFKLGLSVGGGLGLGGKWSYEDPAGEWVTRDEKLAGGGFVGIDLGARLHRVVGLYLGNRLQLTSTRHVVLTFWNINVFGIQIDFHPMVFMSLESGLWVYVSPKNDDHGCYSTVIYATVGMRWGRAASWRR